MSTITRSPALTLPSLSVLVSSTSMGTSRRNFTGGRLFLAKCPFIGLVTRDSFTNSTRPSWAASYPSLALVFDCVTTHGPACKTVPGRLDLHVHTRRQIELHQRVYRLRRRLEDVEQALMRADLELLARLLVHVRRPQHAVLVFHRGQRNRSRNLCPGAPRRLDDLTRGLVQDAVVVGF